MEPNEFENVETPLGEQIDGGNDEYQDETIEEPNDMTDAEADADVLRNAGMGTNEDYDGGCDERY